MDCGDPIANEVEAQIIDDTDSEKVLQAIVDKIAAVNPSLDDLTLGAIASAVRTELTAELARIDVAISTRLATLGYTAPPSAASNATAVRAELATELARLDAAITTRLAAAGYTVPPTANQNAAAIGAREPLAGFSYDLLLRIAAAVGAGNFTGPAQGEAGEGVLTDVGVGNDNPLVEADIDVDANRTITGVNA